MNPPVKYIDFFPYSPGDPVTGLRLCEIGGAFFLTADGVTFNSIGGVSPSQAAVLSLLGSGWAVLRAQFVLSKLPSLNAFNSVPPFPGPRTASFNAIDGAIEGGGMSPVGGATGEVFGPSVIQHPKTGIYAVSFRVKCSPTSTDVNQVGIVNNAQSAGINFSYAGPISTTKWLLRAGAANQATTLAADFNLHDVDIIADGTNLSIYIDSNATAQAVLAQSNVAADEPLFPTVLNTVTQGRAVVTDFLVGFIRTST